jgi:hypothetical protein
LLPKGKAWRKPGFSTSYALEIVRGVDIHDGYVNIKGVAETVMLIPLDQVFFDLLGFVFRVRVGVPHRLVFNPFKVGSISDRQYADVSHWVILS